MKTNLRISCIRVAALIALACCCPGAPIQNPTQENAFEEFSPAAWRTLSGPDVTILPDGFCIARDRHLSRFRWNPSMGLATSSAEEFVPSHSYRLLPGVQAQPLIHARRIRASAKDGSVSVVYYLGPRGLEFDIEVAPGARLPSIELEALDTRIQIDARGRASVGDVGLLLTPVAFSEDSRGRRHSVMSRYGLEGNSRLTFSVSRNNSGERVVIDPVVTYASYFDGAGSDDPIALREMLDGSVLITGTTTSVDLPQGVSLNTVKETPENYNARRCFVARFTPATSQINFVSYFGGDAFTTCSSSDVDPSGRILLVGLSESASGIATPDAQYPFPRPLSGGDFFLARISADGRSLEYSTFLNMGDNSSAGPMFVRSGTGSGETAFLAVADYGLNLPDISGGYQKQPLDSTLVVLRYDLSAHQFDRKTYLNGADRLFGLEVSPTGSPYIFGATSLEDLPLQSPAQRTPATQNNYAGFVAAFTPDLSNLVFSSYLGGQQSDCGINSIIFEQNGSLRLAGLAGNQSIPGLKPARPFQQAPEPFSGSPFSVEVTPGSPTLGKGFLAGGYLENISTHESLSALILRDGSYCLVLSEYPVGGPAGGASFQRPGPTLGCLNDQGNDFKLLTPVATMPETNPIAFVAASKNGGVWSLSSTLTDNEVPSDLFATSFQYIPPVGGPDRLILRYVDLNPAIPVMISPSPLELTAGLGPISQFLFGRNFTLGMHLDVGGQSVPLVAISSAAATVDANQPVSLTAGQYAGRLVIPPTSVSPNGLKSDPFPVTVVNLPPNFLPFSATSDPSTFTVLPPAYPTSQVTWRGQPLALSPGPHAGYYQIQLPAGTAPGSGDLVLTNPRPGGGVQSQTIQFGGSSTVAHAISRPRPRALSDVPADSYQVDRSRMILYTVEDIVGGGFELNSYDLGNGQQLASVSLPKSGATFLWAFELSPDGTLLYLADDQFRIRRIRTQGLRVDLTFAIPTDVPISRLAGGALQIMVLADASESLIVTTPAGRMFIFDKDRPRPYSTDDFPSKFVPSMEPVIATSNFVYAVRNRSFNPTSDQPSPCLVRYEIDQLGISPPEELCNVGQQWGKYAEMKTYDGVMVLEAFDTLRALNVTADTVSANDFLTMDTAQNLSADWVGQTLPVNDHPTAFEIVIKHLDTGEPIGHLPSTGYFLAKGIGKLTIIGNLLLFLEVTGRGSGFVGIVYYWPDKIQRYP
jgi:hypothetical protein